MITYQEIKNAHNIISQCVIRTIFDNEKSFISEVVKGYSPEKYKLERVHCANNYRITLIDEDCRTMDVYISSEDVYTWFCSKQD